jgi:hypothetical protein
LAWRCICKLDLLLAMQLGRPPAIEFSDKEAPLGEVYVKTLANHVNPAEEGFLVNGNVLGVFDATHALSRIVYDIQRQLYLGGKPEIKDMLAIQKALADWETALPEMHRVRLGQGSNPNVVCLHLLHQTASLLLYRPL